MSTVIGKLHYVAIPLLMAVSDVLAIEAVDVASAFEDQAYEWEGNGWPLDNDGNIQFDCSGLTWYAFGHVGIEIPETSGEQATHPVGIYLGFPVLDQLQKGDLLFFDTRESFDPSAPGPINHVGIYQGNERFITAIDDRYGIKSADLTNPNYNWTERLLAARRLPSVQGTPSATFSIGNSVMVTEDDVSVRRGRQIQDRLGERAAGDIGQVAFGPVRQSLSGASYWWWYVDFNSGVDGWIAEPFLERLNTGPGNVQLEFLGTAVSIAGEFLNGVLLPTNQWEFASLFEGSATIEVSIEFDPDQLDIDPNPNSGTYQSGILSVGISELVLNASGGSTGMQISAFNTTSAGNDQFFLATDGMDSFGSAGSLPTPVNMSVLINGGLSMLSNDDLPTDALDWLNGNLSFNFIASDATLRQVLFTFQRAPGPVPLLQ